MLTLEWVAAPELPHPPRVDPSPGKQETHVIEFRIRSIPAMQFATCEIQSGARGLLCCYRTCNPELPYGCSQTSGCSPLSCSIVLANIDLTLHLWFWWSRSTQAVPPLPIVLVQTLDIFATQ
jgi:hypothetical protein